MYAIVEIAGQQFKVEKDQKVFVNRLEGKEGSKVTFDNILLLDNAGKIALGDPSLKGASVEAKILKHLKDDKVIVFKKKRRKGYKVKNGHRQLLTEIMIENILEKSKKTQTKAKEEVKISEIKTVASKTEKAPAKKTAVKKPVAKKPVAKKAAIKKVVVKKTVKKA
ncbi:MAG: 50S ribosomal protein L21 [Flavobacteriales bacterium]|jgi:large subunit ribosomal protein L21|tara:strand:+ start:97 stop:594 length:498 start_codon:yes stop_codon:yes gene_type:complete